MNVPTVGEIIEDAGGSRWRVKGVHLGHWEEDADGPEGWNLSIEVEPVIERVPIPEEFRRVFDS